MLLRIIFLLCINCVSLNHFVIASEGKVRTVYKNEHQFVSVSENNCTVTFRMPLDLKSEKFKLRIIRSCDEFKHNLKLIDELLTYLSKNSKTVFSNLDGIYWQKIGKDRGRRIALFAAKSNRWHEIVKGDGTLVSQFTFNVIKELNIYKDMKDVFLSHGISLKENNIEKVLALKKLDLVRESVLTSTDLEMLEGLPNVRLPFSALLWFRVDRIEMHEDL